MAFDRNKIRLFVEADLDSGVEVNLAPDQVHYLRHVMRRNKGDTLYLFNGRDGEWQSALCALTKKAGTAIAQQNVRMQSRGADIKLHFAPIKGARMDFIAQKATELGVSALQPIITERTTVRSIKVKRLRANAIEAAEQCECLWVPEIIEPVDLPSLLAAWPQDRGMILCDEAGDGAPLEILSAHAQSRDRWGVLVGPEGGFTDREREQLLRHGNVVPIGLGPRIMRADTAALSALTLLQATLGDWAQAPRQGLA